MDEAKLHEFMGKLVTDMGGAALIAMSSWVKSWGCTAPWPTAPPSRPKPSRPKPDATPG